VPCSMVEAHKELDSDEAWRREYETPSVSYPLVYPRWPQCIKMACRSGPRRELDRILVQTTSALWHTPSSTSCGGPTVDGDRGNTCSGKRKTLPLGNSHEPAQKHVRGSCANAQVVPTGANIRPLPCIRRWINLRLPLPIVHALLIGNDRAFVGIVACSCKIM